MSRAPSAGWEAPAALGPAASSRHVAAKRERNSCRNPGASLAAATSPSCSIARLSSGTTHGWLSNRQISASTPPSTYWKEGGKTGIALLMYYELHTTSLEKLRRSQYTLLPTRPQAGERHAKLSSSSTHRSDRALRPAGRASSARRFFILPPRACVCVCSVFCSVYVRVCIKGKKASELSNTRSMIFLF